MQLFDEPTAHLDIPLREQLLELLARQRRDAGAAGLYATHDTTEALALADRVALMRDGRIVQVGLPRDVYDAPVDAWAARLTGPAAEVEVRIVAPCGDGRVELDVAGGRAVVEVVAGGDSGPATDARPGDRWRVVVRPDWAALGGALPGRVSHVAFHGTHTDVRLATDAGEVAVRARSDRRACVSAKPSGGPSIGSAPWSPSAVVRTAAGREPSLEVVSHELGQSRWPSTWRMAWISPMWNQ